MTSPRYQQARKRFLAQAGGDPTVGEPGQGSQKSWGATTPMLIAVGEERGWKKHPTPALPRCPVAQETCDPKPGRK